VIVWNDWRGSSMYKGYAQKIDSEGHRLWQPEGVSIIEGSNNYQYNPKACSDGQGGAYIAYTNNYDDLYVMRLGPEDPTCSAHRHVCRERHYEHQPMVACAGWRFRRYSALPN